MGSYSASCIYPPGLSKTNYAVILKNSTLSDARALTLVLLGAILFHEGHLEVPESVGTHI